MSKFIGVLNFFVQLGRFNIKYVTKVRVFNFFVQKIIKDQIVILVYLGVDMKVVKVYRKVLSFKEILVKRVLIFYFN